MLVAKLKAIDPEGKINIGIEKRKKIIETQRRTLEK
jgi:hypothetical protein